MKIRVLAIVLLAGLFLASCARPECKTRAGKQKRKALNSVQYR
jgi:cytochrome c556